MARWLAILGLLLLAACQQAPQSGTVPASALGAGSGNDDIPSDWNTAGDAQKSKYFEREFEATRSDMVKVLLGQCYKNMRDKAALDACLRQALVTTFDDTGDGARYCQPQSNIDSYTDCIVLGNVAVDVARRLDASVKTDPSIWSGRRGFADFLGKVAVVNAVAACNSAQTELQANECMFDWLLEKLSLPEAMSKKCTADLSTEERGSCLGQAATIRFVRDHLARAEGIST